MVVLQIGRQVIDLVLYIRFGCLVLKNKRTMHAFDNTMRGKRINFELPDTQCKHASKTKTLS